MLIFLYTNTDLGFTIKYPSGLTLENLTTSSIVFSSSDESYKVVVVVINAEASFDDLSRILSQHPFAGGRLLEFNSNNYSLSGHPAIRTITTQSYGIKSLTYGTVLADKTSLHTLL